jgi:hypothetical protein
VRALVEIVRMAESEELERPRQAAPRERLRDGERKRAGCPGVEAAGLQEGRVERGSGLGVGACEAPPPVQQGGRLDRACRLLDQGLDRRPWLLDERRPLPDRCGPLPRQRSGEMPCQSRLPGRQGEPGAPLDEVRRQLPL